MVSWLPSCKRNIAVPLQVQRAITAADAAADAAGAPLGKAHPGAAKPAALDWDLQHTAFLSVRLAGAATGSDDISRSAFVGVGSADPVGARHALALVAEVAYRVSEKWEGRERGFLVPIGVCGGGQL